MQGLPPCADLPALGLTALPVFAWQQCVPIALCQESRLDVFEDRIGSRIFFAGDHRLPEQVDRSIPLPAKLAADLHHVWPRDQLAIDGDSWLTHDLTFRVAAQCFLIILGNLSDFLRVVCKISSRCFENDSGTFPHLNLERALIGYCCFL
jgi:hypothetical protein